MRIRKITVLGLFGIFDHEIPLNSDDRITIIHGPNGFGKTVILRMLYGLFSGRSGLLLNIPFSEFSLVFDDGSHLQVSSIQPDTTRDTRRSTNRIRPTVRLLQVTFTKSKGSPQNFSIGDQPEERSSIPLSIIDDLIPELERVGPRQWRHAPTGEILHLDEIVDRYRHSLPPSVAKLSNIPKWFIQLRDSLHVRLIEAQRLVNYPPPDTYSSRRRLSDSNRTVIPTVTTYSEDLSALIQASLAEYAAVSQSLDSTFPTRLLKPDHLVLTNGQLRGKLGDLEQQRTRLTDAGLLDKAEQAIPFQIPDQELDAHTESVLSVYVEDVERKLSVLSDLADKIELFKGIVNRRFLFKQISVSKDYGFTFIDGDGHQIPPEKLSSGEQHEVILLYELLFKVKPNSLILIDEPELSLHIAWQVEFLQDLRQVTEIAGIDVLLATHSPDLINEHWAWTVELKGPNLRSSAGSRTPDVQTVSVNQS